MHLVVAARVDQQRRAGARAPASAFVGVGRHRAVLAQEAEPGHGQHQVVGQLVEAALDPEVGAEGEREDAVSGVMLPPEWLPTSSTGPSLGDVLQAAHVGPEVQAREQPQAGQRLADVVRVALVEVGRRHARLRLRGHRSDGAPDQRRRARRRDRPAPGRRRGQADPFAAAHPCWLGSRARRRGPGCRCSTRGAARRGVRDVAHAALRAAARHDRRPGGRRARRAGAILCGSPCGRPARQLAHARRARAAGRRSAPRVSITSWRRSALIRLRPIARQVLAPSGWISTTSVP